MPVLPGGGAVVRKKKKLAPGQPTEAVIQRSILIWLKSTGLLYWRQNSGVAFAGNRRIYLGPAGIPDILVVVPPGGRLVGLEVKSANGVQRPVQVVFAAKLTKSGGEYYLVRSLEEAKNAVAQAMGGTDWKGLQLSKRAAGKSI